MRFGNRRNIYRLAAVVLVSVVLVTTAQADGTTVNVREDEAHGAYLVDAEERSLYLFTRDEGGVSVCYDTCAVNWPPLLTQGEPLAGEGLDAALLGATARTDGTMQVTYNGWPLYTFARDALPGDVAGQGVNEVWYLVTPAGAAIGHEPEASPATDPAAERDALFAAFMHDGQQVYQTVCIGCHGGEGEGGVGERLAGNNRAVGNATRVLRVILHGGHRMPPFGDQLTDTQVAAAATYVRNAWGNEHELVTAEEVRPLR